MKVVLIIQARCGSSRLPNKIFLKLNNNEILKVVHDRCKISEKIDKIVIATSTNKEDDIIYDFCNKHDIDCYRGDERDLIKRYYYLCKLLNSNIIIRVTSDCPYIDYKIIDDMIDIFQNSNLDYIYNTDDNKDEIQPEGSDVEIFKFSVLEYLMVNEKHMREHATGVIKLKPHYFNIFNTHKYKINKINTINSLNGIKLSIDNNTDYLIANFIFNYFKDLNYFSFEEVLKFIDKNYEEYLLLNNTKNNMNSGQKLYERAKQIIPGGTQLLSKRPEMFLPDLWPSYYSKVEGIEITDLDGNKYLDMGINGVGTCILGANNKNVNDKVIECINRGNMSTLNHINEVLLTEKLLELHPWAEMARYTRSSGEACAVAIRIARSYINKDKIAFCGYHGWHDWYLAANINKNSLDNHLLKGLSSSGVPLGLENTIYPFTYNNIEELENILKNNDIGIIILEPIRNILPCDGFLEKVRELANTYNCILIFDEVTSGFRYSIGGIHMEYKIIPDIVIFGKAISNGYPLGVILGKKCVMNSAQNTFISSTFWTEGIGFTAALATINTMINTNSHIYIKNLCKYYEKKLSEIISKYKINAKITSINGINSIIFNYENSLAIKTLFIQEMLNKGYITTLSLYMTCFHTKENLNEYLKYIDEFFDKYKYDIENNLINKHLKGPIVHSGFKRLN
jgi:glutamate-1-semialdehyde 2,1-aminomutase